MPFKALVACSVAASALGYASLASAAKPAPASTAVVPEVVVTAQKREERLLSVAAPVTAVGQADLNRQVALRLADYSASVPGLNLLSEREGQTQIALRGVSTGVSASSTAAIYIDESPFGSSTSYALGGQLTPDLDPGELQQVEVLRGPQGTLYGASSLGGLIKYVTLTPSLTHYSGRLEADVSAVDSGGTGYGGRLSVNGPLIRDVLGFSFSAFDRRDPGYITNVISGARNINDARVDGGRLALLWKPTDRFQAKLSAMVHDSYTRDSSDEDLDVSGQPIGGGLKQIRYVQEPFNVRDRLFGIDARYDLGWASLTSITSYQRENLYWGNDQTQLYGPALARLFGSTQLGAAAQQYIHQQKVTEELRLASNGNARFEWLVGMFYTHENSQREETGDVFSKLTGKVINLGVDLGTVGLFSRYTEFAGFGDATYHFTPKFDVQVGVRYASNTQHYVQPSSGLLYGGTSLINADSSDSSATFLVAPRYKFNDQQMVYARIASGYRPGGPNAVTVALIAAGVPTTFRPDTLVNYEVGYKASLPGLNATLDVSAFDIEWSDVQVLERINGISALGNGAGARSTGVELAGTWRPAHGLKVAANMAYTDAHLTGDAPGVNGHRGDELPESPKVAANISVDYDFAISRDLDGFVGLTARYMGDRRGEFVSTAPTSYVRPILKAYGTLDLRAGVEHGGLSLEVFAKNVSDSRGLNRIISEMSDGYSGPFTASVIQPRTFGVSVASRF